MTYLRKIFPAIIKLLLLLLPLILIIYGYSSAVMAYLEYGWAKTWGNQTDESYAYGVATDNSGNVYVVGYFSGVNVDFDPGPGTDLRSSVGSYDGYVSKFDPNGNLLWARTWGSTQGDEANAVATDNSGNVYITGKFAGLASENVDFDGTTGTDYHLANGNNANLFITKYNADGTYGWSQTLSGGANNAGLGIAVTSTDVVFVTGRFSGTVDFNPGGTTENHTLTGGSKMFITKYTTSGSYIWTKTIEGSGTAEGDAIAVDSLGNAYVSGYYVNSIDFDPEGSTDSRTYATSAGFITKYDNDGNYLWVKTQQGAGTGNLATSYAIKTDSNNNIYTSGIMTGTIDFDPGVGTANFTSGGGEDFFLQKLDSDGNYLWAKTIGGASNERGNGIAVDSHNNVYVGGYWSGTVDFNPGIGVESKTNTSDWGVSMFATAYDSSGNYLWTKVTGGGQESDGYSITAYDSGVYLVGVAYGNVDFDPDGNGDIVPGATDYGSSALVKWVTALPVSSPTPSPSLLQTSTSSSSNSNSPPFSPAPAPQSMPSIISATVKGDQATLNFVPGVGPQTSYTVYYGQNNKADDFAATNLGDANSRSITIGGLTIGQIYYFILVPVNHNTEGPHTPPYPVFIGQSLITKKVVENTVPPRMVEENSFSTGTQDSLFSYPLSKDNYTALNILKIDTANQISPILRKYLTPENALKITKAEVYLAGIFITSYAAITGSFALVAIIKTLSYIYQNSSRSLIKYPLDIITNLSSWLGNSFISFAPFLAAVKSKRKKPGIVFETFKGSPVKGAFVVFYSRSGNLKSTFTDVTGRYIIQLKPDKYQIKVVHAKYNFPAKSIGKFAKETYEKIYQANELISVDQEGATISDIAIPVEPKISRGFRRLLQLLSNLLFMIYKLIRVPLGLVASFITTLAILIEPSPIIIGGALVVLYYWLLMLESYLLTDSSQN